MSSAPSMPAQCTRITDGAAATYALGMKLGAQLRGGDWVALRGDLGAGKTTLVQGIVAGMGGGRATSPTFTLINEYAGRDGTRIVHVDAYRLGEADAAELEMDTIGLGDLLDASDAVVLIEWADRIVGLLPADHLRVALSYGEGEDERRLELTAHGPRSAALLRDLLRDL